MPLAAVTVPGEIAFGAAVEALASSKPLTPARGGALPDSAHLATEGRTLGQYVASHEGIPRTALDSLDFSAQALNTGAKTSPTIVIGYVDPNAAQTAERRRTAHLFVVGEKGDKGYERCLRTPRMVAPRTPNTAGSSTTSISPATASMS